MEVGIFEKQQFTDLRSNLQAGARLATGQRITQEAFRISLDQGVWLLLTLIILEIVTGYLTTSPPATFSFYGLNSLGAICLFDLVVLLLIARIARAKTDTIGPLLIANLASTPLLVIASHLVGPLIDDQQLSSIAAWGLPAWQFYIVLRLLRLFLNLPQKRSMGLAGLNLLFSISSLWILPHSEIWYTDQLDTAESPYKDLYALNVENLFYDQPSLVSNNLESLQSQRPGTTDLYLLNLGGYGLENVFLNEVEYVKELFDSQFDTQGHSLILANNAASVARYPMANLHNLSQSLNSLGNQMDPEEDILFLFMTSHGSRQHKFSLNFGPIKLNDLSPEQINQALNNAGIVWRIIVVSSCYSGGFIEPLKNPYTLVITASAADKTSFGCGANSEFTDFGTAYFKVALQEKHHFIEAFSIAKHWVEEKEQREQRRASQPQIFAGEAMQQKLDQIFGHTRSPSWTQETQQQCVETPIDACS